MKTEKKNILFLFSDTGGGHRSITEAIIEVLQEQYGDQVEISMVDYLKKYAPYPFNMLPAWYPDMMKYPFLWHLWYRFSNGHLRINLITAVCRLYVGKNFERIFTENPYDLIVSTHPLLHRQIIQNPKFSGSPVSIVVADPVSVHAVWFDPGADLLFVATDRAKELALKHKISPQKIRVTGFPVAQKFLTSQGPAVEIRRKFGWPETLPMILLMGGGEGMGRLEQTVEALAKSDLDIGIAVVTGRNETLRAKLEKIDWQCPIFVYGFVRDIPEFMAAADVLVTKAGPNTISEAMNAGLPMILFDFLPGQEEGNVTYVTEEGAGHWAPSPEAVVSAVQNWLANPDSYQMAVASCRRIARPNAARDIAQSLAMQVGISHQSDQKSNGQI